MTPSRCSREKPSARRALPPLLALALVLTQCRRAPANSGASASASASASAAEPSAATRPALAITAVRTRFETAAHMLASIEMQLSGEPFAEAMARSLGGYDRNAREPDRYTEPSEGAGARPVRDLPGYAAAIESYEYSRQPMNNVAFESGAGTALAFGALLNPQGQGGRAALDRLRGLVERLAIASRAGVRSPDREAPPRGFVTVPAPSDNPLNTLGFAGLWPTVHPFVSFDPAIRPSGNATRGCTITGGYGASAGEAVPVGDYECGYRSLHLPSRSGQVERTISPGADGFAAWKNGLWVVNYLQSMHDTEGQPIASVAPGVAPLVGREGNTVRGVRADGTAGAAGTYLGANDLEGFQAGLLVQSMHELAHARLTRLLTSDGRTLGGFASLAEATSYDYEAPLRWFPNAVAVSEEPDPEATFPRPATYALRDAGVSLLEGLGLVGGAAELFALTDHDNPEVGASASARAYFDGEPFADDNGRFDAQPTPHDRWLALARVAFVSLDRVLCAPSGDRALCASEAALPPAQEPSAGLVAPRPGPALRAYDAAYTVVTLRLLRRSLAGRLTLYSDATPDGVVTRTAWDGAPARGVPGGGPLARRVDALLRAHAEVLLRALSDDEGNAYERASVATGERASDAASPGDLEAHAAVVRGLLEGYLATGEERFRARAERVFARMNAAFWSEPLAMYVARPGAREMVWTPRTYGVVQGALREGYKLLAARPGREGLARLLEGRFARLVKLVLNGWDDRDDDGVVQWPDECVRVLDGVPRGGLQMAERAQTGELGIEAGQPTADRDHDCVPEIDDAELPAALAAEVRLAPR